MEERKACVEENKLSHSKVLRLLFLILGFISLGLGTVGILWSLLIPTDGVFFKDGKEAKRLLLQHSKLLKGIQ